MENNEMDESRIKQIVKEAIAPLSTKVDALEADVQSLKGDVHGLRYWTIATSLASVGLVLALLAYATSVFSNHMQTLQLLMTAMQLPAN